MYTLYMFQTGPSTSSTVLMKLTKQEQKVYDYILNHRGCTTHDITHDTFVQVPSARLTGLRQKGVRVVSIGQKKYEGSKAFECYAIDEPLPEKPKPTYTYDPTRDVMVESVNPLTPDTRI